MMFDPVWSEMIEFCRVVAKWLFLWSWQSALLLTLIWLIAAFNRARSAEIRHKIWFAGLIAVALLPIWSLVGQWIPVHQSKIALSQIETFPTALLFRAANLSDATEPSQLSWVDWLSVFFVGFWGSGVSVSLYRFFVSAWKMRTIIRTAQLMKLESLLTPEVPSLRIGHVPIQILVSREISNPTLAGFIQPVILLPAKLEEWTTKGERQAIIQHELAHYERGDHLTQILQLIIKTIFFFHPFVRYALNQVDFERELACDEEVLRSGASTREYSEVILKVAEHNLLPRRTWHLTFTSKKQLKRRIQRIMSNHIQTSSKTWRFVMLTKTIVLSALVMWCVTPNQTRAQSSMANGRAGNLSGASLQTTESFKHIYESMREAILKGDKAFFENFFADDYTAISARGTKMTKQQVIEVHIQPLAGDTRLEKVEFNDLQEKIYGDTVIVTYSAEMSGLNKGAKFSQKARITDIWKKNGDKWQSVASHASSITQ